MRRQALILTEMGPGNNPLAKSPPAGSRLAGRMKPAILLALALFTMTSIADESPIRHVVHFKFKPDADPAKVQKVVDEFAALRGKIPVIQEFDYGTNVSPEGLDKGFTHCWILTFKNDKDRDAYLVHPDHKAFVEVLKPVLAEPLVVDFVVKKVKN